MMDLGGLDDAKLLELSRRDPVAFGLFYRRNENMVLAYFLRRTNSPEVAADLCSETFAAALAARGRFRRRGIPAAAWLFGIARRQLGTYVRREKVASRYRARLRFEPHAVEDPGFERIESQFDANELSASLTTALESLPELTGQALRLRVLEDRSYSDIASELGASEGAVRVRVSRGLAQLGLVMGAQHGTE